MIAVGREAWYLIGFVALAVAAVVVSATGWILLFRDRREARRAREGAGGGAGSRREDGAGVDRAGVDRVGVDEAPSAREPDRSPAAE